MRTPLTLALALLLALSVAACGEEQPAGSGSDLTEITWQLTAGTVDGAALSPIATAPVTLRFASDETANGTAACNSYGGPATLGNGTVAFPDGFAVTEMACMDDGVMALEAAYLGALRRVTGFLATDTSLTLTGPGVELRFAALEPEADAALIGTEWALDTIIQGESASTPAGPARIVFGADGSVGGHAGCNNWFGSYDPTTGFSELGSTMMACEEPLMDQESFFLAVLADHATVTVSGQSLTITDLSGNALVFRAQAPVEDTPLVDTTWGLETVITGDVATTPIAGAQIVFAADGTVSGSTGCNSFFGSYDATGFSPIGATKMYCDGVMDQEAMFLAVLVPGATVTVEGPVLTITAPGGDGLQFRAG